MEIKILHLYYDIMNLYGEYGNVRILEKHLKDQGFDVVLDKKTMGEEKHFSDYDFIYMGCGTEKNQKAILADLLNEKEEFQNAVDNEKQILLTGNSFELLGQVIDEEKALGFLNFKTEHLDKRITTDAICTSKMFKEKVVGFINTSSIIKDIDNPLFKYEYNTENLENDGVLYKNVIGTHLIGPLLIRNPEILKYLVIKLCTEKDNNFKYKEINYIDEEEGYKLVLDELEKRKSM